MNYFAQVSSEPNVITDPTVSTPDSSMLGTVMAVSLLLSLFLIICYIKIFSKAGRKWWEAIIPIYSTYVLLKIVGRPGWWLLLFFIPLVNIIALIVVMVDLAKVFGKGVGTAIGLILLPIIFVPVLAFGKAKYSGNGSSSAAAAKPQTATSGAQQDGLNAQAVASVPTAGAAVGAGVGAAQPGAPITDAPLADQQTAPPQSPADINPAPSEPAAKPVQEEPVDAPVQTPEQTETPGTPSPDLTTPQDGTPVPDPSTPTDPVTPPPEVTTPGSDDQQPNNFGQ